MSSSSSLLRIASLLLACSFLVLSCSMMKGISSSQESGRDMPAWFLDNRPMDPHHIFAAATATAPKLQLASSQAASQARGDIAARIETRFQGLTKQFQEEVGQGPNAESVSQFTQAYKSVVRQTINGSEVVKREIKREDGEYRAYVLMRLPIGEAQEKLIQQIQARQTEYTRFRSSQAFEELEREVHGYRQREKEREARQRERASTQASAEDQQTGSAQSQGEEQASAPAAEGQDETGEETSDALVTERDLEESASRDMGTGPTTDQIQAPDPEPEQQEEGDAPVSKAQKIESRLRAAAQPWMGTPYTFGGESRNGIDCSGLTQALYAEAFNVDLPRTTGKQANQGSAVDRSQRPPSEIRPGDLIFFRTSDQAKHVGIYLDERTFLHASSSEGVTVSPLKYDYWQDHYWQTRRLSVL